MRLSQKREGKVFFNEIMETPFTEDYDVVVAGLGTAGAIAAIVAGQKGLRVLGIERMNCMGGTVTAGSVNGYYFGSTGGAHEVLDRETEKCQANVYKAHGKYNVEVRKYVLEREALKAGVKVCYESTVTGVYLENKKVKGIQWIGPEGLKAASCKVLIDCSGDGDVCHLAGCKVHQGRKLDDRTQPFTSAKVTLSGNRINRTNYDSGCTDQTDADQLSEALVSAHAHQLEKSYPEEYRLLFLAPLLGVREGRMIEGEEIVTLEDVFNGKVTDKPIFYAYADVDKHGRDHAMETEVLQDWWVASNLGAVNVTVPVPYGTMVPKGYDGLLAAGRCMSFDHDVSTLIRMIRDMQKAGEAAADAAWLSIQKSVPLKDVPYDELLPLLKETGCFDEKNNIGYKFDGSALPESERKLIAWLTEPEAIRSALSGDRPGVAIWSCRRLGVKIAAHLKKWMGDSDENLRRHSAIALALIGDRDALPLIREMVIQRDSFLLKDCRKNNQVRGWMSVYLLGRFRDRESVRTLSDILTNPEEIQRPLYSDKSLLHPNYIQEGYNETYFQFFSHAAMALIKTGDAYEDLREEIGAALKKAVGDGSYIRRITRKESGSYEYSMVENIGRLAEDALKRWGK